MALSRLKHGFESRWGHQIVFVEISRSGFEKHSNVSRTHVGCALAAAEYLLGLLLVERHRALQLRRAKRRIDLRNVEPRVAEERPHLLEVMMLLQDLEGDAVAEIVRLEHGVADQLSVHLTEPPDVLARHGRARLAATPP